jgi:hypothetical protein
MKAVHSLVAVMLSGALLAVAGDLAAAKPRHHVSGDGSNGSKSADGGQKSGGTPDAGVRNSSTGNASGSSIPNTSPGGPPSDGPIKKGDALPGKSGTADSAKNQLSDHEDVVHPGKVNGTDVGKSDIIADGPGHKTAKPANMTKKITTIFRPHIVRDHQHPSIPGKIEERNAIGATVPNDGNPKLGLEPKVTDKPDGARTGLPGPVATTTTPNTAMPFGRRPGNNSLEMAPKTGPVVSGTAVSRPGSNLTSVGGPSKNIVGALSGSSFKPRHP